ncbi:MAG: hypothetical protein GY725_20015 [bacterium]|nr:hypothetical protein [bacterium]
MGWIFMVMLGMIVGSIIIEKILPQGVKDQMGAAICWSMMALTMTFLGGATIFLLIMTWMRYIQPALTT